MAIPLWMKVIYGGESFSPQGRQPLTYRQDFNATPLSARGAGRRSSSGRSGGKSKKKDIDTPEGFRRNLRDQGLTDEQIDDIFKGPRDDDFSVTSPKDWLGAVGGGLKAGLRALDVPRAAVMSGLVETSDALVALQNKLGLGGDQVQGTDNLRQTGVSWQDFVENFHNRVGFKDVLEGNKDEDLFGYHPSDKQKAAISFAVDVGADPLTYLLVGAPDDPQKLARAFESQAALKTLGREGADKAIKTVLQKGVNALSKEELAAIGRQGGLQARVPFSGAVGRTLRIDRALAKLNGLEELPRTVTLAGRGTAVGDLAAKTTALARSPLNAALSGPGRKLAQMGLAGGKAPERAVLRDTAASPDRVRRALHVITKEPEARHLAKAFEQRMTQRATGLLDAARNAGVSGQDLYHALGGDKAALRNVDEVAPELAGELRKFLDEAADEANQLAGKAFIKRKANYTPRQWSDEARKLIFGERTPQGNKGVRSMVQARKFGTEEGQQNVLKVGKDVLGEIRPVDEVGISEERQIADLLEANDKVKWFNDDAYDTIPAYVRGLSRQLQDEYFAQEMKKLGIGKELWKTEREFVASSAPDYDTAAREVEEFMEGRRRAGVRRNEVESRIAEVEKPTPSKFATPKRRAKLKDDLHKVWSELDDAVNKPIPWEKLIEKAHANPTTVITIEETMKRTMDDAMRQFGANTLLPDDLVGTLRDIGRMNEPGSWKRVVDLHNKVLSFWKKAALLTPGYHWRNSFGGVYMNWMGGVDEGKYRQLLRLAYEDPGSSVYKSKLLTPLVAGVKLDDELREAYAEARRLGVFTGGQSIKEIENINEQLPVNLFRGSRRVGGMIENQLRGAMFIDEYVKNGHDATEALAKTLKYHFDYEDIGKAKGLIDEEFLRQNIFPFYTWLRRSTPLMLEMVARNPGKVNRYFTLKRNVEELSAEEGVTPQYFQDNFAIRLPWSPQGDGQGYLMPDLPLTSLVDVTDLGQLAGQASPFIKTPYEYNAGKQLWKGIPLSDKAVPIPGVVAAVPGMKTALRHMGRIKTGPDGKEVMTQRDLYMLQQFIPQLGQARRLFPSEDKYEDRRMTSWLSFLLGTGLRTNTDEEQTTELWNRYFTYQEEADRMEDLGYGKDAARELAFG